MDPDAQRRRRECRGRARERHGREDGRTFSELHVAGRARATGNRRGERHRLTHRGRIEGRNEPRRRHAGCGGVHDLADRRRRAARIVDVAAIDRRDRMRADSERRRRQRRRVPGERDGPERRGAVEKLHGPGRARAAGNRRGERHRLTERRRIQRRDEPGRRTRGSRRTLRELGSVVGRQVRRRRRDHRLARRHGKHERTDGRVSTPVGGDHQVADERLSLAVSRRPARGVRIELDSIRLRCLAVERAADRRVAGSDHRQIEHRKILSAIAGYGVGVEGIVQDRDAWR